MIPAHTFIPANASKACKNILITRYTNTEAWYHSALVRGILVKIIFVNF